MTIALDERGLLAPGIHVATWADIQHSFCSNTRRELLFASIKNFVLTELVVVPADFKMVVGGSFFSDKDNPADMEMTIYVEVTPTTLQTCAPVFQLGGEAFHHYAKSQYEVDFYLSMMMPGCNDFGLFFQYVGPKTAAAKQLHPKDARGVIEVVPWKLG